MRKSFRRSVTTWGDPHLVDLPEFDSTFLVVVSLSFRGRCLWPCLQIPRLTNSTRDFFAGPESGRITDSLRVGGERECCESSKMCMWCVSAHVPAKHRGRLRKPGGEYGIEGAIIGTRWNIYKEPAGTWLTGIHTPADLAPKGSAHSQAAASYRIWLPWASYGPVSHRHEKRGECGALHLKKRCSLKRR